jgi:chromosome segregation ATPase
MNFELLSIKIINIKALDKFYITFPKIKDNKALRLEGQNLQGKTTVLHCINAALGDTISEKIVPNEWLRRGEEEGGIILELIDTDTNYIYESIISITFTEVKHKVEVYRAAKSEFSKPEHVYRTQKDIRELFRYNYISADRIIQMAKSKTTRRELMSYLLIGLDEDTRNKYNTLEEEGKKIYNERTPLNVEQMKLLATCEKRALSTKEQYVYANRDIIQSKYSEFKNESLRLSNGINNAKVEHREYEELLNKLKTKVSTLNDSKDLTNIEIKGVNEELEKLQLQDADIITELTNKKIELSTNLSDLDDTDYRAFVNLVEDTNNDIKALMNKLDTEEAKVLEIRIKGLMDKLDTLNKELGYTIKQLNELVEPTTNIQHLEQEYNKLQKEGEKITEEAMELDEVLNKKKTYDTFKEEYEEVHKQWIEKDKRYKEILEEKQRIIEESDISIPGFNISVDGVELDNRNVKETQISGAEKRILATQFSVAMNKRVKLAILEEMNNLDSEREYTICKFALNKGYLPLSDYVTFGTISVKEIDIV